MCPSCGGHDLGVFYEVDDVPTNSVLLLDTAEAAHALPRGAIRLAHCVSCGHVHNAAFHPELTGYSGRYESTQSFSPTFSSFQRRQADDLVERFDLRGKRVLEIGCGSGEFLSLLCAAGGNTGIGYDPAYLPGRVDTDGLDIEFVADVFTGDSGHHDADVIVCKMTMEHIVDTYDFVSTVRVAIGDRTDAIVCFQVPNGRRIFGGAAFWDVYYERCSYFTHGSLARLLRLGGFDVVDLMTDFEGQYLTIAARPDGVHTAAGGDVAPLPAERDLAAVGQEIARFSTAAPCAAVTWRRRLDAAHESGRTTALWGGGSKAVSFISTLGLDRQIVAAVDINPNKVDTFLPGSGHRVVSPDELPALRPDQVIVMNPVYEAEVRTELRRHGLAPSVVPLS